jgi:hypothetical protein
MNASLPLPRSGQNERTCASIVELYFLLMPTEADNLATHFERHPWLFSLCGFLTESALFHQAEIAKKKA